MTENTDDPIPPHEWETIVRNVPIVSVDLVVVTDDGVVLGKRTNEPAKGEWFVPGGTVLKHETLEEAVRRIATEEIGTDVDIDRRLGVYEHFYETAELPGVGGKHYVVIAYVVVPVNDVMAADDQHTTLETFLSPSIELELHPYVQQYIDDLGEFP